MPPRWKVTSPIRPIPSCCPTRFGSSLEPFAGWPGVARSSLHDHRLRAKRRCMNIRNHRGARRRRAYRDLLKVARKTAHYTRMAQRQAQGWTDPRGQVRAGKLRHTLDLMMRIIDQTERRVLHGESVPAQEKVVSVFEEHTDITRRKRPGDGLRAQAVPDRWRLGLILDFEVVRGNPNDAAQFQPWLKRQYDLCGRWPRQASFDGCLASKTNLQWAKDQGIRGRRLRQETRAEGSKDGRAPVESTGNCDAFGPGSKVASRCSSESSVPDAAPGKAGPTFNSMWASRSPASTCWTWPACCSERSLEIDCQTAAFRDPCVQKPSRSSKESKILLSAQPTPLYCSFGPLPHPIQSLKIGLSG